MAKQEKLIESKLIKFNGTRYNCEEEFNELKELHIGIGGKISGYIELKKSKAPVWYDSTYELKVLKDLDKCSFVKEIKTQSLLIEFINPKKRPDKYYPDIQLLTTDNSIIIIEVKPFEEMINKNNLWKHKALRKYCQKMGYIHTIIDKDYYSFEDLKKEQVSDEIKEKFISFVKERKTVTLAECKPFEEEYGINDKQICYIVWNKRRKYLKYQQHKIIFKKK